MKLAIDLEIPKGMSVFEAKEVAIKDIAAHNLIGLTKYRYVQGLSGPSVAAIHGKFFVITNDQYQELMRRVPDSLSRDIIEDILHKEITELNVPQP